jgi:hypothetical protein
VLVEPEHGDGGGQAVRHRRPERDEHVHVRAAAAQRVPGADVVAPTDPELHRRRERELRPARNPLDVRAADEHRQHRRDQGQRQDRGEHEIATQRDVRVALALLVLGALARGVALDARVVAGALDGVDDRGDRRRRGIVTHGGGLGREVDRRARARQPVEDLLDARRAGRAGHALQREGGLRLGARDGIHPPIIPYGGI